MKKLEVIKDKLKGDELNKFLHEENSLKREIDLCKNRLSIYFTALLFIFGWIITFIYEFVSIGIIDSSALVGDVSKSLISSSMIITTLISLITVSGIAKDVFLLMNLKYDYKILMKKWEEEINGN